MSWLSWFRARRHVEAEIRAHLEEATRDRIERGESPEAARLNARREFGNALEVAAVTSDAVGHAWMDRLRDDVTRAVRHVARRPGSSSAVVILLALAVGTATAMFAVVDSMVLRPLPFPGAERLAHLYMGRPTGGNLMIASPILRAWRESGAFEAGEFFDRRRLVVDAGSGPIARPGASVSPGLLAMLGARPTEGRLFAPGDGVEGARDLIIISDTLRRALFAGEDVIGRRIDLDGESVRVVGVLAPSFRFPDWNTDIWRPFDYESQSPETAVRAMALMRIRAGVPEPDALARATGVAHTVAPQTQELSARKAPLSFARGADTYRRALVFLAGGVALVFVVLSANVAGLLLNRFTARRREFALCAALGSSRLRLARQVGLECGLLGIGGVALGVLLSWLLVQLVATILPESVLARSFNPLDVDLRTLVVASVLGLTASIIAGGIPAVLATSRASSASALNGRDGTESRAARRVATGLLIAEIALTCALLVGAATLMRSFTSLLNADRGFDPKGIITVETSVRTEVRDQAARDAVYASAAEELRRLPGVTGVVESRGGPMTAQNDLHFDTPLMNGVSAADPVTLSFEESYIGLDFFAFYGVPIIEGRNFRPDDGADQVIVGERFAAAVWPGLSAVGRTLSRRDQSYEVVGVARELNRPSLEASNDRPDFYRFLGFGGSSRTFSLRCGDLCPPESLIRQRLLALQHSLSVIEVARIDERYAADLAEPRTNAALSGTFGAVTLLAAAAGLFSLLSQSVGRRRREFGIRIALGATSAGLTRVVIRHALAVTAAGVLAGALIAWLAVGTLSSLLYGVKPTDPLNWLLVAAMMLVTALIATWRPARDASRIDPAALLRETET